MAFCIESFLLVLKRDLIIAVDVGTTALKLAAVDRSMSIVASVSKPYPTSFPQSGWAEQNPEEWWGAFALAIKDLKKKIPALNDRAGALVFAAQMCGVIAVDESGKPLRPAIIWLDKRAGHLMRQALRGIPMLFGYGAYGLLSSIFWTNGAPSLNGMDPPAKMMWLKKHEPKVWEKTHKLLDVKDWLVHRASNKFVTTADSANLTWMMNTRQGQEAWSTKLMKRYGVPREKLPEIVSGQMSPGGLTAKAAKEVGLYEGLPILAGLGDVCAAALGSGAVNDGELHISIGTSAWIGGFFKSRRLSASEAYATILCPIENRPLLIATQETASACLDWLAKIIGDEPVAVVSEQQTLPLFLPWLAGERVPVDDNRLRGAFLGLNLQHDRASLYAAVMEGIALNLRWAMSSVRKQRGVQLQSHMVLVGGGANNAALAQVLADCLQIDLVTNTAPHMAGVLGAAALASAHLEWSETAWQATASIAKNQNIIYSAKPARAAYYDQRFVLFKKAYRSNISWFWQFAAQIGGKYD